MKKTSKVVGIIIVCLVLAGATWFTVIGGTAYIYAGYLESKWIKGNPKTKTEIEKYLNYYSLHSIDPKDSLWGKRHQLQDGERMVQYRILWNSKCPLDVVYDRNDNIKAIFTSYE